MHGESLTHRGKKIPLAANHKVIPLAETGSEGLEGVIRNLLRAEQTIYFFY
jgi:hypothetical protein